MAYVLDRYYVESLSEAEKGALTLYDNQLFFEFFDEVDVDGQKLFAIPKFFKTWSINTRDHRTPGEVIDIELKDDIQPRDNEQIECIHKITSNHNGMIAARVGFGKTFVAIASICKLKKKTLIIAHKESLLSQWKEKILEYTNLSEDDIGIIKGKKCDFEKNICLSTVQTLSRRINNDRTDFVLEMLNANFGITFYDECHITGAAPSFNDSLQCVFSKRLYGLSATVYRSDGLSTLLQWCIGDIIYDNTKFVLPVYVCLIDINLELGKFKSYIERATFNGAMMRYNNFLADSDIYLTFLKKLINILLSKGRNVLLLSQIIKLLEMIDDRVGFHDTAQIHGNVKEKDYSKQLLLATYGMAKDGMDVPRLDTLVYGTCVSSEIALIQSIGRVVRSLQGKKYGLIFDIHNPNFDLLNGLRSHRIKIYNKHNFKIMKLSNFDDLEKLLDRLDKGDVLCD